MTNLILIVLIGLPLYVAYCLVRPTKACRRCGGWGSKPARRRRAARRHCHRCDGTGKRFRVPALVIHRIRGAQRRHAKLTLRAAERAAEATAAAGPGGGREREQVRP
jgi:hypothetical protein